MPPSATAPTPSAELLGDLSELVGERGLPDLAGRLDSLQRWIAGDLLDFERELKSLVRGGERITESAHHLLDLGGKHLRPMCLLLAARTGGDSSGRALRQLAVAVELVHSATLLHDDVVDLAAARRGRPAARIQYGNAASIFAGDWLLVHALKKIRSAAIPGLLDRMLDIIEEMIFAESVQLENRGRLNTSRADYFRVVEGKTAALFRWAMFAGGRAGGRDLASCTALERYGLHLGVAFQAVDDLLDVDGDEALTGKALFADLRDGKMTYPLILAVERDPSLRPLIEASAALPPDEPLCASDIRRLLAAMGETGALAECRELAEQRGRLAIESLGTLGGGPGVAELITVAEATLHRRA